LSRASRVTRYRRQAGSELDESEQAIMDFEAQLQDLEGRFQAEVQASTDKWARIATEVQSYSITPYKKDIQVELYGVGWVPYYYTQINGQPLILHAYY
jgi:hypothetical protein